HTAKAAGIKVIYSFHDFYAICPSFNLLDHNGTYCGGTCTPGDGECRVGIPWAHYPHLKHAFVSTWREIVLKALLRCDHLVSFSKSARQLIISHYPQLDSDNYCVIEHGQDLSSFKQVPAATSESLIRVVLIGSLNVSKGIRVLEKILKLNYDRKGPFEFHFVGNLHPSFNPQHLGGIVHGPYTREVLCRILEDIRPSFAMISSIWPETFCFALSECWAAGLPVFASDLGTVKERVEQTGAGWLLDLTNAEKSYEQMLRIASDKAVQIEVRRKVSQVEIRPISDMYQDYLRIYTTKRAKGFGWKRVVSSFGIESNLGKEVDGSIKY
ncbi:MAG TPA: glycosyltransferase, partial [Saprospiraceae bacterium]|nr:glycosyltransferase [Saprospiraceae bacterium]